MKAKQKHTDKATVQNLHYLHAEGKIDLNPEYQRGSVWTKSQKQLLIDSLLSGLDVPKLYFREVARGKFEHEVVDGQQRLRAICEFLDGDYEMPADADDIDGHRVAGQDFKSLATPLQMKLHNEQLDVVKLNAAYTDANIEDMFLRLQNGTPLNAPEKRRAYVGNMKKVVAQLSKNSVFKLCAFGNERFGYEDAAAKILHLLLSGKITDIKPAAIKRTYSGHKTVTLNHPVVKKAAKAFRLLAKAFKKTPKPKLKKYSIISLAYLVAELQEKYNLRDYLKEFGTTFLNFEKRRIENEDLSEEKQSLSLATYTNAARSDSVPDMEYRHKQLMNEILIALPKLAAKDPTRIFSAEQRLAVFVRDGGKCQNCGCKCDEMDYHVDHVKAWSRGGKTILTNARLLCPKCNLKKGRKVS